MFYGARRAQDMTPLFFPALRNRRRSRQKQPATYPTVRSGASSDMILARSE
jgi:hypothetical protein